MNFLTKHVIFHTTFCSGPTSSTKKKQIVLLLGIGEKYPNNMQ